MLSYHKYDQQAANPLYAGMQGISIKLSLTTVHTAYLSTFDIWGGAGLSAGILIKRSQISIHTTNRTSFLFLGAIRKGY